MTTYIEKDGTVVHTHKQFGTLARGDIVRLKQTKENLQMTNLHPWDIDNPKSGPVEKFYLLKVHGNALRAVGYQNDTLRQMSCDQLRILIAKIAAR